MKKNNCKRTIKTFGLMASILFSTSAFAGLQDTDKKPLEHYFNQGKAIASKLTKNINCDNNSYRCSFKDLIYSSKGFTSDSNAVDGLRGEATGTYYKDIKISNYNVYYNKNENFTEESYRDIGISINGQSYSNINSVNITQGKGSIVDFYIQGTVDENLIKTLRDNALKGLSQSDINKYNKNTQDVQSLSDFFSKHGDFLLSGHVNISFNGKAMLKISVLDKKDRKNIISFTTNAIIGDISPVKKMLETNMTFTDYTNLLSNVLSNNMMNAIISSMKIDFNMSSYIDEIKEIKSRPSDNPFKKSVFISERLDPMIIANNGILNVEYVNRNNTPVYSIGLDIFANIIKNAKALQNQQIQSKDSVKNKVVKGLSILDKYYSLKINGLSFN